LHTRLNERLSRPDAAPFGTTVVSLQEQMSGWLSAINRARKPEDLIDKYAKLLRAHVSLRAVDVLAFDRAAQARFEDLRRQKQGVGAAALVAGVCQGCHQQLSPVYLDRLKRDDGIWRCEHCRRILIAR